MPIFERVAPNLDEVARDLDGLAVRLLLFHEREPPEHPVPDEGKQEEHGGDPNEAVSSADGNRALGHSR